MEGISRSWLIWQLTGDPRWLGLMVFCHWLPNTLFSMFAGVLADRVDNRKLIMYCESLYLLSALGTGILTVAGLVAPWHVALLLVLHGFSGALSNPSRQVFIHDTVGKDKLFGAVSLTNSLFQCMQFVGPAIGGILIASLGIGNAYLINAMAFVPAIVIMALIKVPQQTRLPVRMSALQSTMEGLRHVKNSPILLSLLLLATMPAILVADAVSALMPVFADRVLHVGADGMGYLLSAQGLGAISAALLIAYMGGIRRKGTLVIVTSFLYGVLLVGFSFSSWYLASMLILVGLGIVSVTSQTVINTSLQLSASDDLRGRVMGMYSLGTLGVRSFNGPMIGFLAAGIGAPMAVGILGSLVAVAVVIIAVLTPDRRKLD